MKIIGYTGEWTIEALAKIIRFSATRCTYFVLMSANTESVEAPKPLDELRQFLRSSTLVTAWPGTVRINGEPCLLRKFIATKESCDALIEKVVPELLRDTSTIEDLSLLRADGRPFFVTITHEHDAFFKVRQDECEELESAIGISNLAEQGDDQLPDETY